MTSHSPFFLLKQNRLEEALSKNSLMINEIYFTSKKTEHEEIKGE